MIPRPAPPNLGAFRVLHDGPFVAGMPAQIVFEYAVGSVGLQAGGQVRIGLPNTGWGPPVPPQQRYWDELVQGSDRRLAPFHPVNTTAVVADRAAAVVVLDVMERMLTPDEDPAIAYWRWWITATLEAADLLPGDVLRITYGDRRFASDGARVQTFAESQINMLAFVKPAGGEFQAVQGSPWYFDVIAGAPSRVNVVAESIQASPRASLRVALTDDCHCLPPGHQPIPLEIAGQTIRCVPGSAATVSISADRLASLAIVEPSTGKTWGRANPVTAAGPDGLRLFWGDLHAQSEHHVMHSQKMDFRQGGWSKGISCGTVDDCYAYARQVSLLDFIALTDQGVCLTPAWEMCQAKVREYHDPGRFVTFKAYEAGAPIGHRNVIYGSDQIEPPLDARRFSNFHPAVLYDYYRERGDAILIPHHVKTWTDWSYHDPELEPVMEIYSCWGQSEWPGLDLWGKGQTPGAGGQEALRRGYRFGLIASSDNHVGMPGRSYPGDRQAHTPYKGGLCAVFAPELTRDTIMTALRRRHCYGTTGARIIVRFDIEGRPMGSAFAPEGDSVRASIEVLGTDEIQAVELIGPGPAVRPLICPRGENAFRQTLDLPVIPRGYYYLRVRQADGERAWTSPIFFD